MMKMTFWLLAAMSLGFIVAWLLSRNIYKKNKAYKEDDFLAVILERNNMIEKLEKSFRNKKIMFQQISEKLSDSEEALSKKTSQLTTLQHKLNSYNSNENINLKLKEQNVLLSRKIQKLEAIDTKRLKELEGFEEIVLLAEAKVENVEKDYKQIVKKLDDDVENMKSYEKRIKALEEELKLYEAESSDAEFIISKDQFIKIEEQLELYQKEIESLKNEKNEKNELLLKSQKSFTGLHFQDKILDKEEDESSMVEAFRKTYKKITKS